MISLVVAGANTAGADTGKGAGVGTDAGLVAGGAGWAREGDGAGAVAGVEIGGMKRAGGGGTRRLISTDFSSIDFLSIALKSPA
jgi:hypothetical protein